MSEQTEKLCSVCGKPMSQCICKKEVIEVRHTGIPTENVEDIKKERDELRSIVEVEALKAFETEKEAFLSQIEDEDKRAEVEAKIGNDPDRLEQYKVVSDLLVGSLREAGVNVREGRKSPPPAVKLPPYDPSARSQQMRAKEFVDELYQIAYDPKKSEAERKEANRRIDELFVELVRGLRVGHGQTKIPTMSQCPQCGNLITGEGEECPFCGWRHQSRFKERETSA